MTETADARTAPPLQAPKLDFNNLPHQVMDKNESPPFIAMVDIRVLIHGLFAETKLTFTLFNPNQRDMEGDMVIPLPSTAVLCGHALDINGKMRKAVIVGKKEGRQILEAEIRKNIDPGLVEKVQGNIHRIRVYPLPGMGWRTVSVTWVSELAVQESSSSFHLPLDYLQDVAESRLKVVLLDADTVPQITGGRGDLHFSFDTEENQWTAACKLAKSDRVDDLRVQLPTAAQQETVIIEQDITGDRFFCISRPWPARNSDRSWQPSRIAIAWDSSGSRTDTTKELTLLTRLLKNWQNITIDLLVFRNRVEDAEQQSFTISNGDGSQLIDTLKALPCDGATDLGSLDLSRLPHPTTEAWLLFSDGLVTCGSGYPDCAPIMVHTITSQVCANSFLLNRIAEQCNGSSYNLIEQSVDRACADILANNRQLIQPVASRGCDAVLVKKRPGHVLIIGILANNRGMIRLQENSDEQQFELDADNAVASRSLARIWACEQAEAAFLLEQNSSRAISLGRRYGVVTSGTSLLILDSLKQYLEYDIEPPVDEQELLDLFRSARKEDASHEEKQRKEHLDSVYRSWQEMIDWWNTNFSVIPEPPQEERTELDDRNNDRSPVDYGSPSFDNPFDTDANGLDYGSMSADDESVDEDFFEEPSEIHFCAREPDCSHEEEAQPEARHAAGSSEIVIQPWQADMDYLKKLDLVPAEDRYQLYLSLRHDYLNSPSFYQDCADYFFRNNMETYGVRVLTNLLELDLDNPALMRTCAYRLQQAGALDLAIAVFTDVLGKRDDEPQSHRDLALALTLRWQQNREEIDLFTAMLHLWTVVAKQWDRFPEIELIALMELNRLLWLAEKNRIAVPERIESRFRKKLDLDLRICMAWDADLTDVDLHVLEPTGDHASYSNSRTRQGGRISRDVRDGYGPEEYLLKNAVKGSYTIKAHYFSGSQQKLCGPCTVMVTLFTDYARDTEKQQSLVLRLDLAGDEFVVGEIQLD